MIDLAEHDSGTYIPLKEIALRQNISQKYLERIMVTLSKAGLVTGAHGKGGGYKLCRSAKAYTVSDILEVTEETLAPVTCLVQNATPCTRAAQCRTLPMWQQLDELIHNFFSGITLAQLMQSTQADLPEI